jgi:hypothetical protein
VKALNPIDRTPSGIAMLLRPEHPLYLQPVITQYFASNKSEIWA